MIGPIHKYEIVVFYIDSKLLAIGLTFPTICKNTESVCFGFAILFSRLSRFKHY